MSRTILLALMRKELIALSRDIHALLALFAMPAAFIVIMSLALKDIYVPPADRLAYAIDRQDDSPAAHRLVDAWAALHGAPHELSADWKDDLRRARLRYVLTIDAEFGRVLTRLEPPDADALHLLADPALDTRLFQGIAAELQGMVGEMRAEAIQKQLFGFVREDVRASRRLVSAARLDGNAAAPTAVQQNVPAWLVFGMFFVVTAIAGLFVQEQNDGALARLATFGVSPSAQLLSKALPYLGVNAVQAILMLSVGVYLVPLLGGDALFLAGADWLALGVVLVSIGLAAVGFALALASLSRTHAQASLLGPMCNLLMAAIGGIMVPTFVMPAELGMLAAYSPMNWGLEGLLAVLLRQGGVSDILAPALKLLGFALAMFALAASAFSRRIVR